MSLKAELGRRLMADMIQKSRGQSKAVVLVVDYTTAKIVSSCLRMHEIMDAGVLVLENIMLQREKLNFPAVYFVQPTTQVIDRLISDFDPPVPVSGGKAAVTKPQYTAAHVFFTGRLSAANMKQLSASKKTVAKLKDLVELNADFLALENFVFSFDSQYAIRDLYFPASTEAMNIQLNETTRHLVSLCLTTHEFPYVRYYGQSPLAKSLANSFHTEMQTTIAQLQDWQYSQTRERGTLLIIDRSFDPVAPLMHEFTFQAMVNDLLRVNGELCFLPSTSQPVVEPKAGPKLTNDGDDAKNNALVLSEEDPLWTQLRHRHIADAMQTVTDKFKDFKSKNKLAKLQSDDAASVKDMIQAMKDMPEYKSMMKRYHKHMSLAQECMDRFGKKRLKDLGDLEQDIATGLSTEGKAVNQKQLLTRMQELCVSPVIGALERLRLVMIFLCAQGGMDEAIKRDLLAGVSPLLVRAIDGLAKLGVDVQTMSAKGKITKQRATEFAERNNTVRLQLMRFVPALQHIMEQGVSDSLDEELWPFVTPPPEDQRASMQQAKQVGRSARRKAGPAAAVKDVGSSDWKREENGDNDRRPRFIVFVIGGVAHSEMRAAYEVAESHKAPVYIGSTHVVTPNQFVHQLSGLGRPEFRAALTQSLRQNEQMPPEYEVAEQDPQAIGTNQVTVAIQ